MDPAPALIGDIGGTNARFALLDAAGRPAGLSVTQCADHPSLEAAIEVYLAGQGGVRPARAAIAVASPIDGDHVAMTNHVWSFSIEKARRRLGLAALHVVNDFVAVALAVPALAADQTRLIGPAARPAPDRPIGVLGPGTGLGMAALVPFAGAWHAIATEGGHATLPATDEREAAIVAQIRGGRDHVSIERALSGPGLVNLYRAIAALEGRAPEDLTPEQVSARAAAGADHDCAEAVLVFADMLGGVAGNLALTLGARGGIYVAGGVVPALGAQFPDRRFRARFEAKGRFRGWLADIPTRVILHPQPALAGLAALLRQTEPPLP